MGTSPWSPVRVDDALRADPGDRFDMVLTNPPFGKKSSVQIVNAEGRAERQSLTVVRDDFWASTSNKQLNFLQHVRTLLKVEGTAAVVVPDNVLFEGGAGETIRRRLLHECNVHTLLRLPTGIFYAQGVKANVLFFDRKPGSDTPWTKELWIYDLRTNKHFTLKTRTLTRADLDDFFECYSTGSAASGRRGSGSTGSATTSWSPATRPASTSSGCVTRAWRRPTISPPPASSPPRSSRTSRPPSPSSPSWPTPFKASVLRSRARRLATHG